MKFSRVLVFFIHFVVSNAFAGTYESPECKSSIDPFTSVEQVRKQLSEIRKEVIASTVETLEKALRKHFSTVQSKAAISEENCPAIPKSEGYKNKNVSRLNGSESDLHKFDFAIELAQSWIEIAGDERLNYRMLKGLMKKGEDLDGGVKVNLLCDSAGNYVSFIVYDLKSDHPTEIKYLIARPATEGSPRGGAGSAAVRSLLIQNILHHNPEMCLSSVPDSLEFYEKLNFKAKPGFSNKHCLTMADSQKYFPNVREEANQAYHEALEKVLLQSSDPLTREQYNSIWADWFLK